MCCTGDFVLQKTKAVMTAGGETFTATGSVVLRPGFTAIMPWKVGCAAGEVVDLDASVYVLEAV